MNFNNEPFIAILESKAPKEVMLMELNLSMEEMMAYLAVGLDKRKLEWLSQRKILRALFPDQLIQISHSDNGKPSLEGIESHVSISHSDRFTAMMFDPKKDIGIDIQIEKENIKEGVSLFMNKQEITDTNSGEDVRQLHIYWGAKESVYKFLAGEVDSLANDIYIKPFEASTNGNLLAEFNGNEIELSYSHNKDYTLVHTGSPLLQTEVLANNITIFH